ncbi:MAG: TonB-dependent receptor [Bacteroidales bacterium]|nr:TonB-dependent receptor [Bacteroidales bacterium]MCB9012821.1 TonB-dependent receptor [Bacteroidales bacterium]
MNSFYRNLKIALSMAFLLFFFHEISAQTVTGKITDENGAPLPGVGILIEGTTTGSISDLQGMYTINVNNIQKDVLVFSFVGMEKIQVPLNGRDKVDVQMKAEAESLDEIVVIGYGTMKKRDLTGSVSSVNAQQLKDIPVTSAAQAITGRLAGVQITTSEGSPDAEVKIRVRGGGSITQDNSPLYIVDGFPVENLNSVPPSDIESIDVLKDASSTAIYGARGANGVVIITTKSGEKGVTKVSYNGYYGVKQISNTLDVLDPYEFVLFQYERNQGSFQDRKAFLNGYGAWADLDSLYSNIPGENWQNDVFGRKAPTSYHNLSIQGGGDRSSYNLSFTNNADQGIMIESGYTRNNLNFRFDTKASDKLNFSFDVKLADTKVSGAGTSDPGSSTTNRLKNSVIYMPTSGLYDFGAVQDLLFTDDEYYTLTGLTDPVTLAGDEYRRKNTGSYNFNGALSYSILKNLIFRTEIGYNLREEKRNEYDGLSTPNARKYGDKPIASIEDRIYTTMRIANTLTLNLTPEGDVHSINAMLGQEMVNTNYNELINLSRGFPVGITPELALGSMGLGEDNQKPETFESSSKLLSYFGRVNYSFKNKFLVSSTIRADGSSKFGPNNRWAIFPSVSAGWRISEEEFMQNLDFLSNMKIRGSYGQAGNDRIDDQLWRTAFKVGTDKAYYINEVPLTFFYPDPSNIPNPNLKWETTVTRNLGLDMGFLHNRLNANIDLYKNTGKELLLQSDVPPETGYTKQMTNIGATSNKGIEFVIDAVPVQKNDLKITFNFNISFNKNTIDDLGSVNSFLYQSDWNNDIGADYYVKVGQPVGMMYGYVTDGFYTVDDFEVDAVTGQLMKDSKGVYILKPGIADNSGILYAGFGPGAVKFKNLGDPVDANGNPVPDGNKVTADADRTIIGNSNPKHVGGVNLSVMFKGFDASVFLNWVYGNNIYNANKIEFTSAYRKYTNLLSDMSSDKRWTNINDAGVVITNADELAERNKDATIWSPNTGRYLFHSWAVEDGSFLRVSNITIGYTLPSTLTKKVFIRNLRIYATGNNLFTFTKYSGFDPEVDTRRSTPLTPGVDYSAYPRSRMYLMGINVTF